MSDPFRYDLIPPGSRVLCALSGGADSMYLLCRLAEGAERGGYTLRAAHYDHRLRETAGRDREFVQSWCTAQRIPLTIGAGDVAAESKRLGAGLEETARLMRYAFLEETADKTGCALIATGHQAGDQAETVLMNLIRGSGLKGLGGIPARRGRIVRPMLEVTRGEILRYLTGHNIPHVEDESNLDPSHTRNRIRGQLLPLLNQLNPQAEVHIRAAAARLREDEAVLSQLAEELAAGAVREEHCLSIPLSPIREAPRPVAVRALGRLVGRAGGSAAAVHLEGLYALCVENGESKTLCLPGCTARRSFDRLYLASGREEPPLSPIPLTEGTVRWGGWRVTAEGSVCPANPYMGPGEFYLRPGEYLIRPRREGDRITLPGRPRKPLKKLMIEQRIPTHLRCRVPVAALGEEAAAAGGLGPDVNHLATAGEAAVHITVMKENET